MSASARPRGLISRNGNWYARVQVDLRDRRISLRTRDVETAKERLPVVIDEFRKLASVSRRRRQTAAMPKLVYFIGCAHAIKIGVATNVERRLRELRAANPLPVVLLATQRVPIGMTAWQFERHLHARFAVHRMHGEWFARDPEILAEIERLNP